jgi:hypothetical protein
MDRMSRLFRFNNYLLDEKAYSIMFHIASLSLRDFSERCCVTMASREIVKRRFYRFSKIFSVNRRFREAIEKFFDT